MLLRKVSDALDKAVSLLFVGYRGHTLLKLAYSHAKNQKTISGHEDAKACKAYYDIQIRRKFGLGFLLSFIPYTEAAKARLAYSRSCLAMKDAIREAQPPVRPDTRLSQKTRSIRQALKLSPFSFMADFIASSYIIDTSVKTRTQKIDREDLFSLLKRLPILSDLYSKKPGESLLHSIFNPVRFVSQALEFSHYLCNKLIDSIFGRLPVVSQVLKTLIALPFVIARVLVKAAESVVDKTWKLIGNLLDSLIVFPYKAIRQTIADRKMVYVATTVQDILNAKVVNRINKEPNPSTLIEKQLGEISKGTNCIFQTSKQYKNAGRKDIKEARLKRETPVLVACPGKYDINMNTSITAKAQSGKLRENIRLGQQFFQHTTNTTALTKKEIDSIKQEFASLSSP